MNDRKKTKNINVRLTPKMYEAVDKKLKDSTFSDRAEYVRYLIRSDLDLD